MSEYPYIIFYDGICGLCNQSIQFIIKHDKKKIFRFAALDSEFAKSLLQSNHIKTENIDTIILMVNNKSYLYSEAVLKIFSLLGFPYNILLIGFILPKSIRDRIYKWIARNRYRIWGKYDSCPIPTEHQQKLFLNSR